MREPARAGVGLSRARAFLRFFDPAFCLPASQITTPTLVLDLQLKHCAAVAAAGVLAALALARVGSPEGALAALLDPAGPRAAALAALAALAWPLIDSPFTVARMLRRAAPPLAIGAARRSMRALSLIHI